jgi:hypothetical protein
MAILLDETGSPPVVQRTIIVTPEAPGHQPPPPIIAPAVRAGVRLAVTPSAYMSPDTSPHQWYNALTATPYSDGNFWFTGNLNTSDFQAPEANPTGTVLPGFSALWVKYRPESAATSVRFSGVSPDGVYVQVFIKNGNTWTLVGNISSDEGSNQDSVITSIYEATYYLRVAAKTSTAPTIRAQLFDAPLAVPNGVITAPAITTNIRVRAKGTQPARKLPPIRTKVRERARRLGDVDIVDCAPITAGVVQDPAVKPLLAAPIGVAVHAAPTSSVSAALTLTAPDDGETVAVSNPQFIVALDSADDPDSVYTIEVQYDSTADFTDPISLTADCAVSDGGATLIPTDPVPAHTFWRARLLQNGVPVLDWTDEREFTVNTAITAVSLALSWTVDPSGEREVHLWHFDPAGPAEGEPVTVYGQGFPVGGGSISLGGQPLSVESWTLVPATPAASGDERTIADETADPEHFEVVFAAPAANDIGGVFLVEAP